MVPIYFHDQSSRAFQIVSHVSSTLRLALMVSEIKRRFGTRVSAGVVKPVTFSEVSAIADRGAL